MRYINTNSLICWDYVRRMLLDLIKENSFAQTKQEADDIP